MRRCAMRSVVKWTLRAIMFPFVITGFAMTLVLGGFRAGFELAGELCEWAAEDSGDE